MRQKYQKLPLFVRRDAVNTKDLCSTDWKKITKILNSQENSKRKVPHQTEKSNDKTHQTNGQQLSYSGLGTGIFKCRKWWIEPGFIALNLSLVWQSHQIPLYLNRCVIVYFYKLCDFNGELCHWLSYHIFFIYIKLSQELGDHSIWNEWKCV